MSEEIKVKEGKTTSEHEVAKSGSVWGIVAMILGFLTTSGSEVLGKVFDADSTLGIIGGAIIAVAGIVLKLVTDLGYIKSRTKVKKAASRVEEAKAKKESE